MSAVRLELSFRNLMFKMSRASCFFFYRILKYDMQSVFTNAAVVFVTLHVLDNS